MQLDTNVLLSSNARTSSRHFLRAVSLQLSRDFLGPKIITCARTYMAVHIVSLTSYLKNEVWSQQIIIPYAHWRGCIPLVHSSGPIPLDGIIHSPICHSLDSI